MYCPRCGWNNPDDATKCANCLVDLKPGQPQPMQQKPSQPLPPQQPYAQQPYYQPGAPQRVPNYLALSIVVTVLSLLCWMYCLCVVPLTLGIIGIVMSLSANSKKLAGDLAGATADANVAKVLVIIGGIIEAIIIVVEVVLVLIGALVFSLAGTS